MTPSDPTAAEDLGLRRAGPADGPPLAQLFLDARRAAVPAMPPTIHGKRSVDAWFGELLESDREVWVAEQDGDIAGYLVLDHSWLDSLYVRPELTGQGIGSVLLDLAKTLRPDGFCLWVFETNLGAQRFYHRHGLVRLDRTDGRDNEEKVPDVRMAWPGRRPTEFLRSLVDEVDTDLARLLARRYAVTAEIQAHKAVAGASGRDPEREAEIVARMAELVPELGTARVARIVDAVISQSLEAAEAASRTRSGRSR